MFRMFNTVLPVIEVLALPLQGASPFFDCSLRVHFYYRFHDKSTKNISRGISVDDKNGKRYGIQ
jgi:hypothetical protein